MKHQDELLEKVVKILREKQLVSLVFVLVNFRFDLELQNEVLKTNIAYSLFLLFLQDEKHILDEKSKGQFFSVIGEKVKKTFSPKNSCPENDENNLAGKKPDGQTRNIFESLVRFGAGKGTEL